jgi:hypothetical protein
MRVARIGIEDAWQIKEMFGSDAQKWDWPDWVLEALNRGSNSQENGIEWDHGTLMVYGKDANLGYGKVDDWLLRNAKGELYVVDKNDFWSEFRMVITKDSK